MSKNRIIKPEAKRLFLEGKEVSDLLKLFPDLKESTVYTWINKEKWREIRDDKIQQYTKTPEIMLGMLDNLLQEVPKMLADADLSAAGKAASVAKISDSVSKIVKSIKNLSKEKDRLSSVLFAVDELGQYMNSCDDKFIYDDEFRVKFDKLLSGFSSRMLEKYSPKNMN